jgi:hypothetical protein
MVISSAQVQLYLYSQDSLVIVMTRLCNLITEELKLCFHEGKRLFSSPHSIQAGFASYSTPCQWARVKPSEHEADHLIPSSSKVKKWKKINVDGRGGGIL